MITMPIGSDLSQYSISNANVARYPIASPDLRSTDPGPHNNVSNTTYQLGRNSGGLLPSTRGGFDPIQLAQISSSRQPSMSGHTGSPTTAWTSDMAMIPADSSPYLPEGFPPAPSDYNNFSEPASYFPGMSPMARQLPQPGDGKELVIRSSASSDCSVARRNEHYGYNGNYELGRVSSEPSQGSGNSNSHGPASTSSSSPKDSRQSSNYGYPPISQSSSEIATPQLGDYSTTDTGTTLEPSSAVPRTSSHPDNDGHLSTLNPPYDCYNHQPVGQRHTGEASKTEQALSRDIQSQYRYQHQPRHFRPLASDRP